MGFGFFKSKETLEYVFPMFKIFKAVYNGKECTKINHNQIINTGMHLSILQILKEENKTFLPSIYRITNHSIFTKRVVPYEKMTGMTIEYKKFVFYVIKTAIEYLQEKDIVHTNITTDSIFIDEAGNACLCDIINLKLNDNTQNTTQMLNGICKKETGCDIDNLDEIEIFLEIEDLLSNLRKKTIDEKLIHLENTIRNKNKPPHIIKQNIYRVMISYLTEDVDKEEKKEVLDFLRMFDDELFRKNQIPLFRVIDYNVRLYMLTAIESIDNMDECAGDIALGIRVKEKPLRLETLSFVFKYDKKFTKKSFGLFLYTMADSSLDSESIEFICNKLIDNDRFYLATSPVVNKTVSSEFLRRNKKEHKEYARIMYKTLLAFLKTKKCKKAVYSCFDKYYVAFDKTKIASELLPLLCSKLTEKENQEECFCLVEKIVKFLKENRSEIEQQEWSLTRAKSVFMSKQEKQEAAFQTKIEQIRQKEGISEEWEDQEI